MIVERHLRASQSYSFVLTGSVDERCSTQREYTSRWAWVEQSYHFARCWLESLLSTSLSVGLKQVELTELISMSGMFLMKEWTTRVMAIDHAAWTSLLKCDENERGFHHLFL